VNKYELYGNWNKVLQKIRLTSMQTLVNELREYEENEADGITETHDDIAAVYLNI
jgi:hypothetical protein